MRWACKCVSGNVNCVMLSWRIQYVVPLEDKGAQWARAKHFASMFTRVRLNACLNYCSTCVWPCVHDGMWKFACVCHRLCVGERKVKLLSSHQRLFILDQSNDLDRIFFIIDVIWQRRKFWIVTLPGHGIVNWQQTLQKKIKKPYT